MLSARELLHKVKHIDSAQIQIVKDFIMSYVYPNHSLNLLNISYVLWTVLLAGGLAVTACYFRVPGKKLAIGMVMGEIIYAGILLYLYFFLWGSALQDGSFYRYMNSYFLGAFIICIFVIQKALDADGKAEIPGKRKIAIALVLFSLCRILEVAKWFAGPVQLVLHRSADTAIAEQLEYQQYGGPEDVLVVHNGSTVSAQLQYDWVPYRVRAFESLNDGMVYASENHYTYVFAVAEGQWYCVATGEPVASQG